jgi:hypothetical protein
LMRDVFFIVLFFYEKRIFNVSHKRYDDNRDLI